ncbi:MAG: hypothetical protein NZO16_01410, partial [Deltaproteobacteria bacterium]|nr:hypothetical protein [Deltaproteobacteria bacterium]
KRLPPLNKEIIKELIGVEISSDICFESAAQQDSGIWIKIVCPFKELTYSLTKVSKIGAKVTLIDFSSVPKDLVAVASELIILSENENIFLE